MSGVQTGTRLERLEQLHARTRQEITSAQRRDAHREQARLQLLRERVEEEIRAEGGKVAVERVRLDSWSPVQRTRKHKTDLKKARRLEQLGVTAKDVKVWAVSVGLLAAVKQGRVKAELIEAYAAAHPTARGGAA